MGMNLFAAAARAWLLRSPKPFEFTSDFDKSFDYQNIKSLGLYVHIPFCRQICTFCPYCKRLYNHKTARSYLAALLDEIELVCANQKGKKTVTSLYFGGGTPALMVDDLGIIIKALQKYFVITEGIGAELHPDDVTVETLQKLKAAGISKISVGMQSFNDDILRKLGRKALGYAGVFEALQSVKFETVAMDFIFALEGQSFESVKYDIDKAFANGVNHIALYPFIDFTFAEDNIKKMKRSQMKKLIYQISDYCKKQGYIRDSIWTFGRPGVDKYSSMTRDNFLGFGCSATTLTASQFKINTFSEKFYAERISEKSLPTALTIRFTKRQRMVYWLFWRFYTTRVNENDFFDVFGVSLKKMYGIELWLGRVSGILKKESRNYVLTPKGVFWYHYFEGFYTLSYIDRMWNLMKNEPFPQKLVL